MTALPSWVVSERERLARAELAAAAVDRGRPNPFVTRFNAAVVGAVDAGLSFRVVAGLAGVSFQRVGQIVSEAREGASDVSG